MSYVDKSVYNGAQENLQLDSKSWVAYMMIAGFLSINAESIQALDFTNTNISSPQVGYEMILGNQKIIQKNKEIELIKNTILSNFDININNHWLPNIDIEKECLFFQCELDESILSDYEKFSKLELDMYLSVKDIVDKSKFFDMVAII